MSLEQALSHQKIARERLEHVLPGPDRGRVPEEHWFVAGRRLDGIGYEAIGGPVAAADDVAGPDTGQKSGMRPTPLALRKK